MLKIEDLKENDVIYFQDSHEKWVLTFDRVEGQKLKQKNSISSRTFYKETATWGNLRSVTNLRLATKEEKHQLDESIKANKFISYEEAMKTFKPQYIVNKWYKVKDWKFSYYVKFKSLEKVGYNKINGEIINAGTYKGDDYLANDQMEEKLELLEDLSEIQEFLPANHPDKVSNSLIGRYVKCLRDAANSCQVDGEYVKQGKYYQIGSIKENDYVLKDGNYLGYIDRPDSQFENLGFELMPVGFCPNQVDIKEWSVGSYAVFQKNETCKRVTVGKPYKIIDSIPKGNIEIIDDDGFNSPTKPDAEYYNLKWFATFQEAEQFCRTFKQKPMETNNEFKVGDWVVRITDGSEANKVTKNKAYKIISLGVTSVTIENDINKKDIFDIKKFKKAELHQIPTKDLSNEELLSIAKTYYPIGTKFEALYGHKSPLIVEENNHIFTKNTYCDVICVTTDKGNGSPPRNSAAIWSKEKGFAKIISSPNEIKGIKPSDEIEVGDEVECNHGKGIVLAISEIGNYLVNGKTKSGHTGCGGKLKKGKISDKYDSWYYNLNELKLIRKANNTTTLTQTKKDDVLSPKVENKVTVQIIERKIKNPILNISVQEENQSIFVPLIQKETKKINNITIKNFSLTV